MLEDSVFEDSIDGTRIRATYTTKISRKGRIGEQGENNISQELCLPRRRYSSSHQ